MAYKTVHNSRKQHDALYKAHHVVFKSFEAIFKTVVNRNLTETKRNGTGRTVNLISFSTAPSKQPFGSWSDLLDVSPGSRLLAKAVQESVSRTNLSLLFLTDLTPEV